MPDLLIHTNHIEKTANKSAFIMCVFLLAVFCFLSIYMKEVERIGVSKENVLFNRT